MKHTNNLNLTLYEPNDIFNVTGDSNSLNNNMKIIDDNLDHKITKFYASNLGEKSLHDSDNGKIEDLHIYGKSEQQQYSGKNLFDFNAWKDSISSVTNGTAVYGDNSIKLTATDNHCDVLGENYITAKPSTTYTLSWNADSNKEGEIMIHMDGTPFLGLSDDNSNTKKITFTTNSDTTHIRVQFGVTIAGESITYSNIQLEVGETATSYEPYVGGVPAPNPNYPQEIKSVGDDGNIEIITYGKNLFIWNDYTTAPIFKTSVTPVESVIITSSELQIVTDPTINKVGLYISSNKMNEILSDYNGQLITLSCEMKADTKLSINFGFDSSSEIVSVTTDWNKYNHIIDYNSRLTTNYLRWFANCQPKTTYYIRNIQIEIGNTATEYEPYKSKTATISTALPLYGIPVESGGNYTDSTGQQWVCDELIYNADGTGKVIKNTEIFVFDGSNDEKWINSYTTTEFTNDFRIQYSKLNGTKAESIQSSSTLLYCNRLQYNNTIWNHDIAGCQIASIGDFIIRMPSSIIGGNGVVAFKSWLANNPLIVVYQIVSQEIELSTEELQALNNLPTYYPITNVSATSGSLDADMIFNYPISLAEGWNYVKQQLGDTRNYIYSMDLQSAEAYVNSEYAVALMELEV